MTRILHWLRDTWALVRAYVRAFGITLIMSSEAPNGGLFPTAGLR